MTLIWILMWGLLFLLQSLLTTNRREYILMHLIVAGIIGWKLYNLAAFKLINNPQSKELFVSEVLVPLCKEKPRKKAIKLVESDRLILQALKTVHQKTKDKTFMTEITNLVFEFLNVYVRIFSTLDTSLLLNIDALRSAIQHFKDVQTPTHEAVRTQLETLYSQTQSYIYALENKLVAGQKVFDRVERDHEPDYIL